MDFSDKTVVITGGATGIGFAVAKVLGADGANVVIAEPRREKLDEAAAALGDLGVVCLAVECDVTDLAQVEALADAAYDRFGRVDVVMNNAGINTGFSTVPESAMDEVRAVFDVNFFGVWHGCRVFGQRFLDQEGDAAIYNTGSENSIFLSDANIAGYAASKHAVFALTEALREQMPDRVHVGLIIPGFVASEMTAEVAHLGMDADVYAAKVVEQMKNDEDFVVSHPYHMVHVHDRYERLSNSYERYAPRYEGDDAHDYRTLMPKLMAGEL